MGERYHIGDLTVDTNTNTVTRSSENLSLSPRTFHLLVALARRAPKCRKPSGTPRDSLA